MDHRIRVSPGMDPSLRSTLVVLVALVAGCTTPPPPPVDRTSDDPPIQAFFESFCITCHGNGAGAGGLDDLLDADALIAADLVVPGEPQQSPLFTRVRDEQMPPNGIGPRPGAADVEVLEDWIRAGAPTITDDPSPDGFVTFEELVDGVALDLAGQPEGARAFQRWISLAPLYNAGEDVDRAVEGLALALNGLSRRSFLVSPRRVGPQGLALRIDLRDIVWTPEDWSDLVADATFRSQPAGLPVAEYVTIITQEPRAIVPADWFVATAWSPGPYADLLDLDEALGALGTPEARVAFHQSGVSAHNRAVDVHRGNGGRVFRSWDFDGSVGARNVVAHPIAARELAAGGEVIFTLPNGLHGYLLIDAQGQRIDDAPVRIVRDPAAVDGVVRNGGSCVRCHGADGILPLTDDAFTYALLRNHGETAQVSLPLMTGHVEAERIAYRMALSAVADPDEAHAGFVQLMDRRRAPVDLLEAADQLGIHPDLLEELLLTRLPALPDDAVSLLADVAMPRDAFEASVPELLCALLDEDCTP